LRRELEEIEGEKGAVRCVSKLAERRE